MKSTSIKATVARMMTIGLLAGAFVVAAPTEAQAQVSIGVQFGYPQYDYNRRDYYDHLRWEQERREAFRRQEEFERQQAFLRRKAWERQRAYGGYGCGTSGRDGYDRTYGRDPEIDRDRR
jgi:hypothetical protein